MVRHAMLAAALLTAFALCQWSAPAFALPIQWTLENVKFSDGASASGTFVYDADTNAYTDINITTTTASRPGAVYTFVCAAPCTGAMADQNAELNLTTSPSSDQTGLPGFILFFFPSLSNSGGLRAVLGALEADCSNSTCAAPTGTKRTAGGSVVAPTTSTPTNTPVPQGGACATPAQCSTGFCVDSVCCDTACTDPLKRCNLAGQVGTCASTAAAAPTLTPWGLVAGLVLLAGTAAWAIRRRAR